MSEQRKIRYLEAPRGGRNFDGFSLTYDIQKGKRSRRDDDFALRTTCKSFRLAEIDGELYVLVMDSIIQEASDPFEISGNFSEIDEGFDEKIEFPYGAFGCTGQRNKIINALKISKEGFLEIPSNEIMEDLLSRKGSFAFECGAYQEDDFAQDDSYDVFINDGDIGDDPFDTELVTPEELGIVVDEVGGRHGGITVVIGEQAVRLRNNGTVRDKKGNKFKDGELVMVEQERLVSELAQAAAEKKAADEKYSAVLEAAKKAREERDDINGPGDDGE